MLFFSKLDDKTQMPNPLEATRHHNSKKLSIPLPLRAIQNNSFQNETPCIYYYVQQTLRRKKLFRLRLAKNEVATNFAHEHCTIRFLSFILAIFINPFHLPTYLEPTYAINSSSMHGNFSHIRPTFQSSLVQILAWLTAVWSVGCAGPGLSGETSRAKRSSSFEYRLIARH